MSFKRSTLQPFTTPARASVTAFICFIARMACSMTFRYSKMSVAELSESMAASKMRMTSEMEEICCHGLKDGASSSVTRKRQEGEKCRMEKAELDFSTFRQALRCCRCKSLERFLSSARQMRGHAIL